MLKWSNTQARLARFFGDEEGAVTVDWVVLTAAVVGLGMGILTLIGNSSDGLAVKVADRLDTVQVGYSK